MTLKVEKSGRVGCSYHLAFLTSFLSTPVFGFRVTRQIRRPFHRGQPKNEANTKESKEETEKEVSKFNDIFDVESPELLACEPIKASFFS